MRRFRNPPPEPPLKCCERMRLLLDNHYRGLLSTIICIVVAGLMVRTDAEKPVLLVFLIVILATIFLIWPMHIGMSALVPIFTIPILGIMNSPMVCQCFMTDCTMMFLAVMGLAVAYEQSRNPYRCILFIMKLFGTSHTSLLFGICFVTASLSVILPSYMATLLMMPIVSKLVQVFERQNMEPPYTTETKEGVTISTPSSYVIAYYLAIAYSANIGSLCFLISSPATLAVKAQFVMVYPSAPDIFSVFGFLYFSFSAMLILFVALYLYVLIVCVIKPWASNNDNDVPDEGMDEFTNMMEAEYDTMPPVTFREHIMVGLLAALLLACITSNFPWGWRHLAENEFVPTETLEASVNYIGESVIFVVALIFVHATPFKLDLFKYCLAFHTRELPPKKELESLTTWKHTRTNIPWAMFLLIGGGVAVARAFVHVKAAEHYGPNFADFESFHIILTAFIFAAVTAVLCNTVVHIGACSLVMPFAMTAALHTNLHPAVLPYTIAAASNFVYMLPVSWSSIQVVQEAGKIPLRCLIFYGIGATIISVLVLLLNVYINISLFGWDAAPTADWTTALAAPGAGGGDNAGGGGDPPATTTPDPPADDG